MARIKVEKQRSENMSKELAQLKNEKKDLKSDIDKCRKFLKEKKKLNENLKKDLNEKDSDLSKYKADIEQISKELGKKIDIITALKKVNNQCNNEINNLNEMIEREKEVRNQVLEKYNNSEGLISEIKVENLNLKQLLDNATKNSDLKSFEIMKLGEENLALNSKISKLNQNFEENIINTARNLIDKTLHQFEDLYIEFVNDLENLSASETQVIFGDDYRYKIKFYKKEFFQEFMIRQLKHIQPGIDDLSQNIIEECNIRQYFQFLEKLIAFIVNLCSKKTL
ncbi:MAG: hypothetical protein MHPSP_000175 [Paramarteilia canceri]